MCPAVTVAVREQKPFSRLFRSFLKSALFEQLRIPLIVNASSGIVNGDSADRDHAVGAKRR